ncbi:MAG TPA: NRDE family protein, partial [Burkholderiales bacterium]|nr:NRDE family protein [Burkholderiales bacterium]
MCLILIAYRAHPEYPLVIAANRDEAFARPAAPAQFWEDHPAVYAGRDLEQRGTWLGIALNARFAAVTNFRREGPKKPAPRSRGELASSYLTGTQDPRMYLNEVRERAGQYNGFSVLVGDMRALYFLSNHGNGVQRVPPGVHGLSNHLLNEPWPKVTRGVAALRSGLDSEESGLASRLFELLADRTPAADDRPARNAAHPRRDRELSTFILGEQYGTRAS